MKKLKLIVWVDPEFKERIDRVAREHEVSTGAFIREAVAERVNKSESPEVAEATA